jgi:hypothetical protein
MHGATRKGFKSFTIMVWEYAFLGVFTQTEELFFFYTIPL